METTSKKLSTQIRVWVKLAAHKKITDNREERRIRKMNATRHNNQKSELGRINAAVGKVEPSTADDINEWF